MENRYLAHHGIKGQKWGIRRYQNYDGTLKDTAKKDNKNNNINKIKKAVKIGTTAAGVALAVYGTAKLIEYGKTSNEVSKYVNAETIDLVNSFVNSVIKGDRKTDEILGRKRTESEYAERAKEIFKEGMAKNRETAKKKTKELTKEVMKYNTKRRINKVKDFIDPNPFGPSYTYDPLQYYRNKYKKG